MSGRTDPFESDSPVDALVLQVLQRIEQEGLRALHELCRRHPAEAVDLRRRLRALHEAGLLATAARREGLLTEEFGEGAAASTPPDPSGPLPGEAVREEHPGPAPERR